MISLTTPEKGEVTEKVRKSLENIWKKVDEIVSEDILMELLDRVVTYIEDSKKDIPKILKVEDFKIELEETIIRSAKFRKIKRKILSIFPS